MTGIYLKNTFTRRRRDAEDAEGIRGFFIIFVIALVLSACSSSRTMEDAPIITSASKQHTLYNGEGQPIEAEPLKKGAPAPVITYFLSEEDLHADRNGSSQAPVEVGYYYVRVRRPAGNGYRAGKDITVDYHIQKTLVTITADERQEFTFDGKPKTVVFSVDRNIEPAVSYFAEGSTLVLSGAPAQRGLYHVLISWPGDAHHMGSSKNVDLVIR
jgi:hypothetical protein